MNNKNIIEKKEVIRECGAYTCIHCVINTCTLEECDMYERRFMQEG